MFIARRKDLAPKLIVFPNRSKSKLNRIELVGIVGNVRHSSVGDRELSLFTVATNLAFKDADSEILEKCKHIPNSALEKCKKYWNQYWISV